MTTPTALINQALKAVGVLGVGQTALAEDMNDGFISMKQMLSQWEKRRWLVPFLKDVYGIGNNLVSNKIGPGQYYSVKRPDKIQAAYVRLNSTATENSFPDFNGDFNDDFTASGQPQTTTSQTVDYPLIPLFSYEDYSLIVLKGLNSFPQYFFYDAHVPYGNIFIWPIPSARYEVHLIIKGTYADIDTLTTEIVLPPEYEEAIWTNLAIRMCTTYQISASKELIALAKVALNTIKNANAQIPELVMPAGIRTTGSYNIYSDSAR